MLVAVALCPACLFPLASIACIAPAGGGRSEALLLTGQQWLTLAADLAMHGQALTSSASATLQGPAESAHRARPPTNVLRLDILGLSSSLLRWDTVSPTLNPSPNATRYNPQLRAYTMHIPLFLHASKAEHSISVDSPWRAHHYQGRRQYVVPSGAPVPLVHALMQRQNPSTSLLLTTHPREKHSAHSFSSFTVSIQLIIHWCKFGVLVLISRHEFIPRRFY